MVEQWNSGTVVVEEWNRNSGRVLVEQCGRTLQQVKSNGGTVW